MPLLVSKWTWDPLDTNCYHCNQRSIKYHKNKMIQLSTETLKYWNKLLYMQHIQHHVPTTSLLQQLMVS